MDDDDKPVTRERLQIELERLHAQLETERLERQRKALMGWQFALAVAIYVALLCDRNASSS